MGFVIGLTPMRTLLKFNMLYSILGLSFLWVVFILVVESPSFIVVLSFKLC